MENEEVEEGEIKQSQSGEGSADFRNSNGAAGNMPEKLVRQQACNGNVTSGEALHGEDVTPPRVSQNNNYGFNSTPNAGSEGLNGGPRCVDNEQTVANTTRLSKQLGPTPQPYLGKRARALRSPPSIGSTQGP
ncbi:hypothetical protein Hanom_Chr11g01024951 [Helianthus anomalus]